MPTPADAPLRKVTLNLYEEDCRTFEKLYPNEWTVKVREAVCIHAMGLRMAVSKPRTLGDLE